VPVVAYPVPGPFGVFHASGATETDFGALADDLRAAAISALDRSPDACRAYAERFDWDRVTDQFLGHVAPV